MYELTMRFKSEDVESLKNLVEEFCQKIKSDPEIEYHYPEIENYAINFWQIYEPTNGQWI